jgi:ATP-binding cassette subfamily B protein
LPALQARLCKVNKRVLTVTNTQNLGAQFIENIKNMSIVFFCANAVIIGDITFGVMISTQFILGMLNGNTTIIPENKDITLKNVMFQYTAHSPLVLQHIYLDIPENKVTAIVGGSGSILNNIVLNASISISNY